MRKPITVLGKTYPSMSAACKEYGLELSTVSARVRAGVPIDEAFTKKLASNRGRSLVINGKEYRSVAAAAKAHGLPPETLTFRLRNGFAPSIAAKQFIGTTKSTIARDPILYKGEVYASLASLAKVVGIHWGTLLKRKNEGMSLADAISIGKIEKGAHHHVHLYTIRNLIDGRIYVGLTSHLERRRLAHFGDSGSKTNRHLRQDMERLGREHFSFSHVFTAFNQEMAARSERQLIAQLQVEGVELYNLNAGGGKGGKRNRKLWNFYKKNATEESVSFQKFSARVTDVGWSMDDAIKYPIGQGPIYGITFRGVRYRTRREAATAHGIEVSTVYNVNRKGMSFEDALEHAVVNKRPKQKPAVPITVKGVRYNSHHAAAKAHGMKWEVFQGRVDGGIHPDLAVETIPQAAVRQIKKSAADGPLSLAEQEQIVGGHSRVDTEGLSLSAFAKRHGFSPGTLKRRIEAGIHPDLLLHRMSKGKARELFSRLADEELSKEQQLRVISGDL